MKKIWKKVTAAMMIASMATCMTVSASASCEDIAVLPSEDGIVMIDNYECVKVDDKYFTTIGDEIYQVFVPTEENRITDETLLNALNSGSIVTSVNSDWYLSDGVFSDYVDLTPGGYCSPIIHYDTSNAGEVVYFKTEFVVNTRINGDAYVYYMGTNGSYTWHEMSITATHNAFNNCKVIMANSIGKTAKKFYINIYKDGTDATTFNYKVYQGALVV